MTRAPQECGRASAARALAAWQRPPDRPRSLTGCQAVGGGVVELPAVGPGSDLSEELVVGVEPAALDRRVAPGCPPGLAANRHSSAIMIRQTRSASRRFKQRMASLGVPFRVVYAQPRLAGMRARRPWTTRRLQAPADDQFSVESDPSPRCRPASTNPGRASPQAACGSRVKPVSITTRL